MDKKVYTTIGLMSGTSLDGVDAALLETDGYDYVKPLNFHYIPYSDEERAVIRPCFGQKNRNAVQVKEAEKLLTVRHAETVLALMEKAKISANEIDLVGFHGQTIYHAPKDGVTIQIGDGALLANETGVDVIYDFRSNDVSQGGEGAPLAPVYHRAMVQSAHIQPPVVLLNIGGVSNITWIGGGANDLIAFDTGPGNALIDDWILQRTGERFDQDGRYASGGKIAYDYVQEWLKHSYFLQQPPKSLDRDEWDIAALGRVVEDLDQMSTEDGAATLTEFSVQAILTSLAHMPVMPLHWYAAGGGRNNSYMMQRLKSELAARGAGDLRNIDVLNWNGDAVEAECFGYLAVRSHLNLPISFPLTTNVPKPLSGGILSKVKK